MHSQKTRENLGTKKLFLLFLSILFYHFTPYHGSTKNTKFHFHRLDTENSMNMYRKIIPTMMMQMQKISW